MVPEITKKADKGRRQPTAAHIYDAINHTDGQHGMPALRVQQWHTQLSGDQQLSNWT